MTLAKIFNTPLGDQLAPEETTGFPFYINACLKWIGGSLGCVCCICYDWVYAKSLTKEGKKGSIVPTIEDKNEAGASVKDMEFYIEVRTILNQVRSGTYLFFHAPKTAPKSVQPVYYE